MKIILPITIFVGLVFSFHTSNSLAYDNFPKTLDKSCRKGDALIYDECSDQSKLFKAALAKAREENKSLLVSYGAEWCIWSHVFDAYINGKTTVFNYTYALPDAPEHKMHATLFEHESSDVSKLAKALNHYVNDNFVVVHIEANFAEKSSLPILVKTRAIEAYSGGVPYNFVVDAKGLYVGHIDPDEVEVRRDTADWYRGYDRQKLLEELKHLREKAKAR